MSGKLLLLYAQWGTRHPRRYDVFSLICEATVFGKSVSHVSCLAYVRKDFASFSSTGCLLVILTDMFFAYVRKDFEIFQSINFSTAARLKQC